MKSTWFTAVILPLVDTVTIAEDVAFVPSAAVAVAV
jgi:hypothetical protein